MKKPLLRSRLLASALLCGVLWNLSGVTRVQAAPASGSIISYQGILSDATGAPVGDGAQNLTFKIYQDGTVVFSQTAPVLTVNGVFNTFLSIGALTFDPAHAYELGITFNGVEARHSIAAVPVAINASNATNAASATNFTGALAGDVTGTQGATKVTALQGTGVVTTSPANGQVLRFNATSGKYEPSNTTSGTVTSVTASAPLTSSGGNTPNIALTSPLPLTNGGTGATTQNFVDLSSAQTIDGIKTFDQAIAGSITGSAASFTGNLAGDVTGTQGATIVSKLQGTAVATTAPTTGQVLTYNGTQYVPATSPAATVQSDGTTITGDGSAGNKLAVNVPLALSGSSTNAIVSGTNTSATTGGAGSFTINNANNGSDALTVSTNGSGNAINAIGNINTSTQYSIGNSPVLGLTGGPSSVAVGVGAGANNTGNYNAFVGPAAGESNTTGNYNVFIGQATAAYNTTGSNNALVGTQAGYSNTTGSNNVALGNQAGFNLTTGNNNIDIGNPGLGGDDSTIHLGTQNTQTKTYIAGISGNTGVTGLPVVVDANGQLGTSATVPGTVQSDGTTITGDGSAGNKLAIQNGGVGQTQVTNGYVDLSNAQTVGGAKTFTSPVNTSTQYNIGGSAALSLTGGTNSVAVGGSAGANNTGSLNAFLGTQAGLHNTTGGSNAFVGAAAGEANTTGGGNVFLGALTGLQSTTGGNNTYVGSNAGLYSTTGSSNIALGSGAGSNLTTGSNNIDIGHSGVAAEAATIHLGTQNTQTKTYIAGISGNTGVTGLPVVVDANGQLGTSTSAATVQSDGTTITGDGSAGNKLAIKVPLALSGSSTSSILNVKNNDTGFSSYGIVGTSASSTGAGVSGTSASSLGTGVSGTNSSNGTGVSGTTNGNGTGGYFSSDSGPGVYSISNSGYAGYFSGNVRVTGTLSKGGGSFQIDDPLDPANKYLYHSFVESPDMMNIYNGVAVLGANGTAVVTMPAYFSALNKEFRYQLTCIGGYAPVYVATEISVNRFEIAGGKPGLKVSWQVTGIRQDAFANANRIPVEVVKTGAEHGRYLYPQLFGQSADKGIAALHQPRVALSPAKPSS